MNHKKIKLRAAMRAADVCAELLTVQKAAGAGLSPDISLIVGDLCETLEMQQALIKRYARQSKRTAKAPKKHRKAAESVGPLQDQVSRLEDFQPDKWQVRLEKAQGGHHGPRGVTNANGWGPR